MLDPSRLMMKAAAPGEHGQELFLQHGAAEICLTSVCLSLVSLFLSKVWTTDEMMPCSVCM